MDIDVSARLLENAAVGAYKTSLQGDVLWANDVLIHMLGFGSLDEFKAANAVECYLNPADRSPLLEQLTQHGKVQDYAVQLETKSKTPLHVLVNAILEAGVIHGLIINKTESRMLEQQLLNAAQQWRSTFDSITDRVALIDRDGKIIRCNKAMADFAGRSFNEILGQSWWRLACGESAPEEDNPIRRAALTLKREEQVRRGGDKWTHISADPVFGDKTGVLGFTCILRDITEHKHTELLLQQANEQLRAVLNAIPGYTSWIDSKGHYIGVSEPLAGVYHRTPDDFVGKDIGFLDNSPEFVDFIRRFLATPDKLALREVKVLINNAARHLLIAAQKYADDAAVVTVGIDITEAKHDKEEKEKLQQQLIQAQKIEAIGKLAGGIAHDFNNLLTAIIGYTDIVLNDEKPNTPHHDDLTEIRNAAERAAQLTRQLLAFSRKQILQMKVYDVNKGLQSVSKMIKRLIGENIELVTLLDSNLFRIKADGVQIDQVVMNLAINASDAMPGGGKLILKTENKRIEHKDNAAFPEAMPGNFVCLSVEDTGTGMSKEVLQHLFEPFYTTKNVGEGTGLGTSVVYGIVKQHEGWIHVYSEPGHGTVFKIYLPAITPVGPAGIPPAEGLGREAPRGRGKRVLIVEDDGAVRGFVSKVLERHGYVVTAAETGGEALSFFEKEKTAWEVAIVDLVLPDVSGAQLARQFSAQRSDLPIVLCSGHSEARVSEDIKNNPKMRFLQKPYTVRDLLAAINEPLINN